MTELGDAIGTARKDTTSFALANCVRSLSIDAVEQANSGHPGAPMGLADVATVLWTRHLKFDPIQPDWPDRDRFVLSNGHASMLQYSLLYLTGFESMPLEELKNFRQWGSVTPGHPEFGHTPGIDITTGPLGQGLAGAVGMAIAESSLRARFGKEMVDHRTWVICGDGCLMEGISQEAISLAGHLKLNKLTVIYDDNGISIDGSTDLAFTEDVSGRFQAAGWRVIECDGHDHQAIDKALVSARQETERPTMIKMRTVIGFGSPNKSGKASSHGAPLGTDERDLTLDSLNWSYGAFDIPEALLDQWRQYGRRGTDTRKDWESRVAASKGSVRAEFERRMAGQLPESLTAAVARARQELVAKPVKVATRKASQLALDVLAEHCPELIGGSADLSGSNLTRVKALGQDYTSEHPEGRYISYGVREFGMAAMMNGMAVHRGLVPYGGTFLVFSDYARNAIRLSALMNIGVVYVMTHDSIGLGEDGPTHQPVEHLASFRAMPRVTVLRPADVVETLEAWEIAVQSRQTPTLMALSRQGVPQLRLDDTGENLTARGGYIIREFGAKRDLTLLATGTEVSLAVDAASRLHEQGVNVAVVSMPSWELFEQNPEAYQHSVLGDAPRIAIEAASKFGWTRYVASDKDVIGMTAFGASAPADSVYQHMGITEDAIIERANTLLQGSVS
ncbi:MAG: transketolase [Natronospirillum sp.]|uniref:transketolase n=1 Tax=Natronospirillum sp. TaxID=2812955 RepID=UPI0025CF7009|nr:transketolase [Natronospirillum sp.]MCH8551883.1 transketolase [Natronospirillum sp.]